MADNQGGGGGTVTMKAVPEMSLRDKLRASVFSGKKAKRKAVRFFGADIELQQPLLRDIISAQSNEDREAAIIETLIKYAFIPGTDEHIFEEADADAFKQLPFGKDFIEVSQALESLTEVNFLEAKPGSGPTGNSS